MSAESEVLALLHAGRVKDAAAAARLALKRQGRNGRLWHLLGVAYLRQQHNQSAVSALRRACECVAKDAEVWDHLGLAESRLGLYAAAQSSFERGMTLAPGRAATWSNAAKNALHAGLAERAAEYAREAVRLSPQDLAGHANLGNALRALGQLDAAIGVYQAALANAGVDETVHNNLASMLLEAGRLTACVQVCRQVLSEYPDSLDACTKLAVALMQQDRLDEALQQAAQARRLAPGAASVYNVLGLVFMAMGQLDQSAQAFRQALTLDAQSAASFSGLLFCLLHDERVTPQDCWAAHRAFAQRFEQPLRAGWHAHTNARDPDRPLKLGFVSGDLRHHPVAHFIAPVWAALDPAKVELWVYSNHNQIDAVTQRLRGWAHHWRQVADLSDEALAQTIRGDGVDVLIDLSGHTAHHRLLTLARKPAPVQATWIGYPGTTGLSAVDYLICDGLNAPPGLFEHYYAECFARLPSSGTFEPHGSAPPVNDLPALTHGYVTFASFNRPGKLGESVIQAWSQVLRRMPDARLLLCPVGDSALVRSLSERFGSYGVAPQRLIFKPKMPMADYLTLHHEVDLLLDTWPYTGGTTTNHALWMGVPVVTLRGPSRAHCQSAAALGRLGLHEWVADDVLAFVEMALNRAQDLQGLAQLRAGLRHRCRQSPLRQASTVARGLEAAVRIMWHRWCAGQSPVHFEVPMQAVFPEGSSE